MPSQFAAATTAANAASTALHTMYVSHTLTQAALPSRRGEYEARWAALEAWPDGRPVTWSDVPWPPCRRTGGGGGGTSASAAPPRAGDPRDTLQLEPEELRRLLFAGATGPAAVKAALRRELMRWRVHSRLRAQLHACAAACIHRSMNCACIPPRNALSAVAAVLSVAMLAGSILSLPALH